MNAFSACWRWKVNRLILGYEASIEAHSIPTLDISAEFVNHCDPV